MSTQRIKTGGFVGSVLAMVISWSLNKSILWALLHGTFGWLYVLYYFFALKGNS